MSKMQQKERQARLSLISMFIEKERVEKNNVPSTNHMLDCCEALFAAAQQNDHQHNIIVIDAVIDTLTSVK